MEENEAEVSFEEERLQGLRRGLQSLLLHGC